MLPNEGKHLHRSRSRQNGSSEGGSFEEAIAAALRSELGSTHQATKTVMRWTGASERAVKYWLAGTYGPSGQHLIALLRHSDAVLMYVLTAAGRPSLSVAARLATIRPQLLDLAEAIDPGGHR